MAGEVILELWNERDAVGAELQGDAGCRKELLGIPGERSCRPTAALYGLDHAEPDARPHFEHAAAQWDLHIEVGCKDLSAVGHVGATACCRAAIGDPTQPDVDQPARCNTEDQAASRP